MIIPKNPQEVSFMVDMIRKNWEVQMQEIPLLIEELKEEHSELAEMVATSYQALDKASNAFMDTMELVLLSLLPFGKDKIN